MSRTQLSTELLRSICKGEHPEAKGLQLRIDKVLEDGCGVQLSILVVDENCKVLSGFNAMHIPMLWAGDTFTICPLSQLFKVNIGQGTIE